MQLLLAVNLIRPLHHYFAFQDVMSGKSANHFHFYYIFLGGKKKKVLLIKESWIAKRFLWPSNFKQPRRVFPILLSSFSRESDKKLMSFYSWKWLCNVLLVKFPSLMLFTFREKGGIIYTIGLYYFRFKDRNIVKLSQSFSYHVVSTMIHDSRMFLLLVCL